MQTETLIAVLVGFQLKHYIADYTLQPAWILHGKGNMRAAGGYAHAGLHAIGTLAVLALAGLSFAPIIALAAAEFVLHYVIDYGKAKLSARIRCGPTTQLYWTLHGGDQFLHQLTYVGLVYAAIAFSAA